jgi:hypothetical protein
MGEYCVEKHEPVGGVYAGVRASTFNTVLYSTDDDTSKQCQLADAGRGNRTGYVVTQFDLKEETYTICTHTHSRRF